MTEDEAKTKWCPMNRYKPIPYNWFRYIFMGFTSWMNSRGDKSRSNCIASDCMMWQWKSTIKQTEKGGLVELPKEEWTGYCGLARR
jgi:hypothetical protein